MDSPEISQNSSAQVSDIRRTLQRLERRDWWLWTTAIIVMLLLVVALFVVTFPTLWQAELQTAIDGLLGLVLLFSIFVVYQQVLIKRLRNEFGEQLTAMSVLQVRAELYEKLAVMDPLTELYNRRFAGEHLPQELSRAERHGYRVTVLMLDLDDFKQVNDRHGHAAGDATLQEFARRLKRSVRSSDMAVRMGGDEFMVALPECQAGDVDRVLARVRGLSVQFDGITIPVSFSAGWVEHEKGESAEHLLARADQALYADKRGSGKEEYAGKDTSAGAGT